MKKILIFTILLLNTTTHSEVRHYNLPDGFLWRYTMDEFENRPRAERFWREAIFHGDKIIALNVHQLVGLDLEGKTLWKYELPSENPYAQAKIYPISDKEMILVVTDALIKINTDTGAMVDSFTYDVNKRSAFQFTELLPKNSALYKDKIYVFLGPQLLSFQTNNLNQAVAYEFNSSPKTIPLIVSNKMYIGFRSGRFSYLNLDNLKSEVMFDFTKESQFSIRQPVYWNDILYIPTTKGIFSFKNNVAYSESSQFKNGILSVISNTLWLRQHNSPKLLMIDETLSPVREVAFTTPKYASAINTELVGNTNTILHINGQEGTIYVIHHENFTNLSLEDSIYTEDFMDNPPILFLAQNKDLILLGGFDGLYLVDFQKLHSE